MKAHRGGTAVTVRCAASRSGLQPIHLQGKQLLVTRVPPALRPPRDARTSPGLGVEGGGGAEVIFESFTAPLPRLAFGDGM